MSIEILGDEISAKYASASRKLGQKRIRTMDFASLGSSGALTVSNSGAYQELQAEIAALETALSTADACAVSAKAVLDAAGFTSARALEESYGRHVETINVTPRTAMMRFESLAGEALRDGSTAMPTELPALLSGYQAEEAVFKAEIVAAQAAIVTEAAARAAFQAQVFAARAALA